MTVALTFEKFYLSHAFGVTQQEILEQQVTNKYTRQNDCSADF